MYYYRIFDDKEELNFFKSSLDYAGIAGLLKEYEKKTLGIRQQGFYKIPEGKRQGR
ncbi:MAG: hypothetical protein AB2L26_01065 [Ignavibacteria bacterium]